MVQASAGVHLRWVAEGGVKAQARSGQVTAPVTLMHCPPKTHGIRPAYSTESSEEQDSPRGPMSRGESSDGVSCGTSVRPLSLSVRTSRRFGDGPCGRRVGLDGLWLGGRRSLALQRGAGVLAAAASPSALDAKLEGAGCVSALTGGTGAAPSAELELSSSSWKAGVLAPAPVLAVGSPLLVVRRDSSGDADLL